MGIPGDPEHQQGFWGDQVIHGVSAQVCLTLGQMGPQTHPVVNSPVLECVIGIDPLSS